ncbi:MAG: peptidase U32 family protein [Lachnospirales bacterium]
MNKVELLAPAGDLEKLKIAILYGADAVYIGGQNYGLRAKAKNFTDEDMIEGVKFAHNLNKKVYVTANIFAHNDDFEGMKEYFKKLETFNIDGLIISDLGIFSVAKETVPNMEIHISTQANTTNYHSVKMWETLGAKRVVLARELSFKEIKNIKENIPNVDLESFVHGAMCISYSGRCLLSNYMTNRDANKGECAHPCRWKYSVVEEKRPGEYMPIHEDERGTYIYNSKDLCMVGYIDELIDAGVNSLKVEGRIKTSYYIANVISVYREAIDDYYNDFKLYKSKIEYYISEIKKCSHRDFTTGFYDQKPNHLDQIYTNNSYIRNYEFVGLVKDYNNGYATIEQRNKFTLETEIEVLRHSGENFKFKVEEILNIEGECLDSAPHPQEILKIKIPKDVSAFDIFRVATS